MTTAFAPDRLDQPLYGARFGQAVRRFFRKYATFTGRASRSEYWWSLLFLNLVVLVAMIPYLVTVIGQVVALTTAIAASAAPGASPSSADATAVGMWTVGMLLSLIPLMLVSLAIAVPSLALQARRHHDVGMSGWMLLLTYVTGGVWAYVIGFLAPKLEGLRFEAPGTQQPVVAPELAAMAAYGAPVGFPQHSAQPGYPAYGAQPGPAPQPGPYGQHPRG